MRELLELFCFVSMVTRHVLLCVCVRRGYLVYTGEGMDVIVAIFKRSMTNDNKLLIGKYCLVWAELEEI